ncbi:MAG: outer membrane protein assembly factor BamD [Pyrinomonadaceae bacterium]|nr:outer membrane protein assembly factor BamD [Pyrinomonadaceae bacterium]
MKRSFLAIFAFILLFGVPAFAQRNIDPAIDRDPLLEADARKNLDVAWQGFGPARKAYKQVLLRFEETFAAYPEFSKMDEFLYLAGMSSYYLSRNEGKQKVNLKIEKEREKYSPEKLRQDAVAYFALMLERNPQSPYKDEVTKIMQELQAKK